MFTIVTKVYTRIKSWLTNQTTLLPIDLYIKLEVLCIEGLSGIFKQIIFTADRTESISLIKDHKFFLIRTDSTFSNNSESKTNIISIQENFFNKENTIEISVNDVYFLVMTDYDLNTKKAFCLISNRMTSEFMEQFKDDVTEITFNVN